MITDELARNREGWAERANELRSLSCACKQIAAWDSPAGDLLRERLQHCGDSIAALADHAEKLAEAYELHLQVVSAGGRIQL